MPRGSHPADITLAPGGRDVRERFIVAHSPASPMTTFTANPTPGERP